MKARPRPILYCVYSRPNGAQCYGQPTAYTVLTYVDDRKTFGDQPEVNGTTR